MDEPAPKRRKTTPPEERERSSSPLKKPPRRPSFASPTKASIARGYPGLVKRPASANAESNPNNRRETSALGKDSQESRSGEKQVHEQMPERGGDEEADVTATPSHRPLEGQEKPRGGMLYSLPSKHSPRVNDLGKQSPLKQSSKSTLNVQPQARDEIEKEAEAVKLPDPELESKKREKARLQREVKELEEQINQCTEEITKMQEQSPTHVLAPWERDNLISLINKIADREKEEQPEPPITNLLCSFLPFSTRPLPRAKSNQDQKPVPSHRPLELDDPLPYLQMFTSFDFTTHLSLPQSKISLDSDMVHQKHTINATGPHKLLAVSLSILIDTSVHKILDLQILSLSPWAERELGKYMRHKAKTKDIGNACWALDSYWSLAKKRAEYWHRCVTAFAHLIPSLTNEEDSNDALVLKKPATTISRKDLNRHLGRDVLVLRDKHVLFKIKWLIDFDWTGEADSRVEVGAAFPAVWTEADESKSLNKIPETFESLLTEKGVFEATRIMVALLFGGA